jgi:hypothetical protein
LLGGLVGNHGGIRSAALPGFGLSKEKFAVLGGLMLARGFRG